MWISKIYLYLLTICFCPSQMKMILRRVVRKALATLTIVILYSFLENNGMLIYKIYLHLLPTCFCLLLKMILRRVVRKALSTLTIVILYLVTLGGIFWN